MIMNDLPTLRLVKRRAGATYVGRPCFECGAMFYRAARIVIVLERGNFMTDGWKEYHRVCHPTFDEIEIARFVARLERQIATLAVS